MNKDKNFVLGLNTTKQVDTLDTLQKQETGKRLRTN